MGLFDFPAPLYTAIDHLLGFLPQYARLLLWALITAALSMACYWACSAQDRIAAARQRAIVARNRMAGYEGTELAEVWPLIRETLAASGRHFMVVLFPAVLGSIPALTLIVWVSNQFSYTFPESNAATKVWSMPAAVLADLPLSADDSNAYTVAWPASNSPLTIHAVNGSPVLQLPLAATVPVVHQRAWWNVLIGNPNGYLPNDGPVAELRFDLPAIEYLNFGPTWIRGWVFSYFVLLVVASLAIKSAFRIH